MATQADPNEMDIQAQMAKNSGDMAEINQREMETKFEPRKFWPSAVVAASGLIAGTITLTKLFL